MNQSSCKMNSKLENFLLTKDFDHLSPHNKLFVTEFMTELEYGHYRQFLLRSKEVFQGDKANLKPPNFDKKALLETYRKKFNIPKSNVDHKHKNTFNYLSNPIIMRIAAIFILSIFIFKFNDNLQSSNTDPSVVTEYLLQVKEVPEVMDLRFDINSSNKDSIMWEKKIDSFIKESKTMNDDMTIYTYGLEVAPIISSE